MHSFSRDGLVLLMKSAVAVTMFAGAAYLWASPPTALSQAGFATLGIDAREEYWRERITSVGGPRAYHEFAAYVADETAPSKHLNAHAFGTALYDAVGLAGITTCDGLFSYGCFHAFMIRAVETEGVEAAQGLHTACTDTLGSTAEQCQHGIGHGLLGIIGYGFQDLDEALRVCDGLTPISNRIGGCAGGVFMEYGLRGMQGLGLAAHRPFIADEALEPCASLSLPDYRASCAYWQPMWWMETHPERGDDEAMARTMGQWCRTLSDGDTATYRSCIAGITNRIQLLTDEDPAGVAGICTLVTDTPDMREYCQRMSAQRYNVYYPLDFSLRACDGLSEEARQRCRTRATEESAARRADQAE